MESFEILSPGAKIKNIRKKIGLKQYEITGGEVTRNLISIIENDKAALTKNVAKVVASNINAACEEKDINFHVTYQYLMESEKEQAVKIVDNYLKKLSVDNFKDLSQFEKFIASFDIGDRKSIAYEKLGDIYFVRNDYYKGYTYYVKAYEFVQKDIFSEAVIELILKLVQCNINFKRYNEALEYLNSINTYDNELSIETYYKVNKAKINLYIILDKFELALEEIEFIEEKYLENEIQIPNELLKDKASCLKSIKQYSSAMQIQNKILESVSENSFEKIIANADIIEIYMMLRDNRNLRRMINECRDILVVPQNIYKEEGAAEVFYTIASACKFIGEGGLGKEYYDHCLNSAKINKNIDMTLKSLNSLFEVYSIERNIEEIDSLKNELIEIISMRPEVKGNDLVFKILSFYNDVDDKDTLRGMISFILE